jgi:hypothetical protein
MITTTYTYITFWSEDDTKKVAINRLEKQLSYFTETQTDANFEDFLTQFLEKKPLLDALGIEKIAIFHTLLYDNQCNTEFSPKVVDLIRQIGATFCISTDRIASDEPYDTSEIQIINPNGFKGDTLYQILDKIRERPVMYTGEHSLSALFHFINGFFIAHNNKTFEIPSFDGFNDFIGEYYGKHTTAGWKNLILADHYGNESEAIRTFYELLDEFRAMRNAPSSREIVHRLLNIAFLHFRGESNEIGQKMLQDDDDLLKNAKEIRKELWKINRVADMLHNSTNPMKRAKYSFEYDNILQQIFERAFDNPYLLEYIKNNAPQTSFYEYQLWKNNENETIFVLKTTENKTEITANSTLLCAFFAINEVAANELKAHFIENK